MFKKIKEEFLLHLFLKIGSKLFKYADIFSPGKEFVEGVTFSNDPKYIDVVSSLGKKTKIKVVSLEIVLEIDNKRFVLKTKND